MVLIRTEEPHRCDITIFHEETWYDPLPQLVHPETGDPFDVTGMTFELFARPTFGHATLIKLLTSTASAGIIFESASTGLIALFLAQTAVEVLPAGDWDQFLRFAFTDVDRGAVVKTLWRGHMTIRPGRDSV